MSILFLVDTAWLCACYWTHFILETPVRHVIVQLLSRV